VRAVTTFKPSHVPQVKAQDATFFVAQQFAQYARFPATELPFELREDSLLTVAFSAEGSVTPTDNTATLMPPLLLQCRLDGKPCAPGDNESQIQFKFSPVRPQVLCCDSRAFTWVVPRASKGTLSRCGDRSGTLSSPPPRRSPTGRW
jgi:hypothetical protein